MSLFSSLASRRTSVRSVLGLLGVATVLAACSKPAPPEEPVRAVKVLTVGLTSFDSGLEYAGEVKARVESRLGLRVAGKITQRTVEVGQRVKAGQVLARLDPRDYQLATDAGRAQVVAATTQRDLAAADLARYKALKDQNFISGAELERREATLKAAQAALDQAQAQLAGQGNQAAYTQLVADVSGVVTAVEAEVGQVVAAGTPVVRIAQDGPRDVVFAVPEDKLARVPAGSTVTVRPWSGGAALSGTVREVAASADPVTRTFPVKVTLPASGGADALPLGATVYVVPQPMAPQATGVIKLPTSALRQEGRGIGLANKIRAYALQDEGLDTVEANNRLGFQADLREYGLGAQMLVDLGVRKMRLLTNNPKKVVGLEGYGLTVEERVPLQLDTDPHSSEYMRAKKEKLGHLLKLQH